MGRILSICIFIFFCNIAFTNDYISTAKQILGEYIVGGIKNSTPDFIKSLDIEYIHSDDYDSTFSLNAVSSLSEGDTDAFFNQTSIYQHDGNTTFNTGFGYRNLFNEKKTIIGEAVIVCVSSYTTATHETISNRYGRINSAI